jgi:hypothetical protein
VSAVAATQTGQVRAQVVVNREYGRAHWSDRRVAKVGEVKAWERRERELTALRAGALSGAYVLARVRAGSSRVYSPQRLGVDLTPWPSAIQARVVGVVAMALAFGRPALAASYAELGALMGCSPGTARNAVRAARALGYVVRRPMFERDETEPTKLWQVANVYEPGPALRARWETFQVLRLCRRVGKTIAKASLSRRAAAAARRRWDIVDSRQKLVALAPSEQSLQTHAREGARPVENRSAAPPPATPTPSPAPSGFTQLDLRRQRHIERIRRWYERASWDPVRRAWTKGRRAGKGDGGGRPAENSHQNAPGAHKRRVSGGGRTPVRPLPNSAQGEAIAAHLLAQILASLGQAPPADPGELRRSVRRARWREVWRRKHGRYVLPEDP